MQVHKSDTESDIDPSKEFHPKYPMESLLRDHGADTLEALCYDIR
jgi:hypothetical protein